MKSLLSFIARFFISLLFLFSGISKILHVDATIDFMQKNGIEHAMAFLVAAVIIEILCGLGILIGIKHRFCALVLFIYLAIVTCIFHLNFADPQQRVAFFKNLAILGSLLFIMGSGCGQCRPSSRN